MADNVTVDTLTGDPVVASDDISSVQYQRVKMTLGANGVNDGDVSSANPMPVTVGAAIPAGTNNIGDVDVASVPANPFGVNADSADPTGSYSAKLAYLCNTQLTSATALAAMDDWDESDRAKVNPIAGQAGVAAGAGNVSALTQRVVLATDVALPAGTNNIGDVDIASIAAGDNNIGNVDVASVPANPFGQNADSADPSGSYSAKLAYICNTQLTSATALAAIDDWDESDRAKVNPIVGQAGVQGNSGTVSANTQRVVLATDVALPTGTNSIGQVTANAGTNLNTSTLALESGGNLAGAATSLAILDDWDESDRAKVNPIAGQAGVQGGSGAVSALTQRVCLATDVALPAGTNNIGDVDIASIAAGTTLIGDVGLQGRATGGLDIFRSLDIDESEEEVKATAGTLYSIHAVNMTATPRYLKFYNATAASVTVGTTTPVLTFPIPSAGDTLGNGFSLNIPQGLAFGTAISVACTTGLADADTGAPGANDVIINLGYK